MATDATFTIQGDVILEDAIARFRHNEEGADQDIARRVKEIVEAHGYIRVTPEQKEEMGKEISKDILTGFGLTALFSIAISGLYNYIVGFRNGRNSVLDTLPPDKRSAFEKMQRQQLLDRLDDMDFDY